MIDKRKQPKLIRAWCLLLAFLVMTNWSVPGLGKAACASAGTELAFYQDRSHKEIEKAAKNQLKIATKKFEQGEYWQSAIDLIVILDFYANFTQMDEVIYRLGSCLYEMELYDGADMMYRYLLKTIPKTPLLPQVLMGLQKVYYHKVDYQQSLKFYKTLEAHFPADKIMNESRYYAAQSYYQLKNYRLVPNIVQSINKDSEFYAFGLYTTGLVQLKKKMFVNPSIVSLRSPNSQSKAKNIGI
ncbi:MAG: tol-pal system YbgF family protein [bacterium]